MEKLIVTVTVDSTMSYPGNPLCPPTTDIKKVSQEYIRAVNAGASITHIHGVHELETEIQLDGRRLSRINFEGWKALRHEILAGCDTIMQFGIASARQEEKIRLMGLHPDMMAVAFNPHDEFFQPDSNFPANEMYAIHPRTELVEYARAALEHNVKVEVEAFHTGAFWNLEYVRSQGLLQKSTWVSLFLGWSGGLWIPPTPDALVFMVNHLPQNCNWNLSVMDPVAHWPLLTQAIAMGGHVRVGWEDNPYLVPGELADTNARLVEKVVRLAKDMGREVATPEEARKIIGFEKNDL